MSAGEAGYYGGLADEDSMLAAAGAMVGMGILPTTIGLFALYRIRRWHGLLHGLPLAYTASVAWPLVTLNVIVIAVYYVLLDELGTALPFALSSLVMAVVGDVWLFLRGWQAAKQPLTSGPRPEVS
jgi:hypothetical protein